MNLLTQLFRWFGGGSTVMEEAPPMPRPAADCDLPTTKAPLSDEAPPPAPGWWAPRGEVVASLTEARIGSEPIASDLYDALSQTLNDPQLELPRIPQVANRALTMLRDASIDFHQLARVVETDQALAASVLRTANSAAYRGYNEITNLEQAFLRMGQRALRSMVLGFSIKHLAIRTGGPQRTLGEELWRRSTASAVICGHFAVQHGLAADEAFLVGLLHDIGMLAVSRVTNDFQVKTGRRFAREVFDSLCEEWHEHIGLRLADEWNLPSPLPELIGNHHSEIAADDPLRLHRSLIALSDVVCSMLEIAPYVPYDFFNLACVRELGIQDDEQTRLNLSRLPELIRSRSDIG
ncbi:MAG: HDOD domain-containing protein [Phycisphaerales bacterium]|nr:HDOD domain-containing protein [Phycisphaerales bacterium]